MQNDDEKQSNLILEKLKVAAIASLIMSATCSAMLAGAGWFLTLTTSFLHRNEPEHKSPYLRVAFTDVSGKDAIIIQQPVKDSKVEVYRSEIPLFRETTFTQINVVPEGAYTVVRQNTELTKAFFTSGNRNSFPPFTYFNLSDVTETMSFSGQAGFNVDLHAVKRTSNMPDLRGEVLQKTIDLNQILLAVEYNGVAPLKNPEFLPLSKGDTAIRNMKYGAIGGATLGLLGTMVLLYTTPPWGRRREDENVEINTGAQTPQPA